jgi:hypothetical protein
VEALVKGGHLDTRNLGQALGMVPVKEMHKYALDDIESRNGLATIRRFVEKINKLYEVNTSYEMATGEDFLIRAQDEEHVKQLKLTPEFNAFRMEYNRASFDVLRTHLKANVGPLQARTINGGWEVYSVPA